MKKTKKNEASVQTKDALKNALKDSQPTGLTRSNDPLVQQDNKAKANIRWFKNQLTTVSGKILISQLEDGFEFHLINPMLWNVKTQQLELLSNDPDKFKTSATTLDAARSIFWVKWTIYCQKRFGRKISLEIEKFDKIDLRDNTNRSHERDHTQIRTTKVTHSSEFESAKEIAA